MTDHTTQRISDLPAATPVSRVLRALFGLGLMATVAGPVLRAPGPRQIEVAGVVLGLVLFYTLVHVLVSRYLGWLHPWLGAAIAATPVFLVWLNGGVYAAGAVLFIGASLLLIAALGHPGCEVLAFPALLLGRRTHLACLLFSPIDWVEGKVIAMLRGSRA